MPKTTNRAVMNWLFIFAFVVAFLIVFGGFVRLTRSGLSIVEWNPISGSLPPIGQQAWEQEFAKYQLTPEFKFINTKMDLAEYKYIFFIEWIHRLIARLAGLAYAIPVFYFLLKKNIPFKEFGIYFGMGTLFIAQAFMGWYMVASGLVDIPAVSHFRLTIHLLLALTLFALSLWTYFGHRYGFASHVKKTWSSLSKLALTSFIVLIIQISYGGMTAGLKAGHVSNTWPLMFDKLIPPNLFTPFINILESGETIVFIHRWLAWLSAAFVVALFYKAKKQELPRELRTGLAWAVGIVGLQILLGILTILFNVQIMIALLHQANAVVLFGLSLFLIHRLRAGDLAQ